MAGDRDDGGSEEDRAAILKRRAVFIAAAVAGLGLAASCGESNPSVCLEMPPPPNTAAPATTDTPASGTPQPCLDMPPPEPCLEIAVPEDAGVTSDDAGRDAGPGPQPCLRKAPPPGPCLKVAPPPPPPQACLDMPPPKDE